MLKIEKKEKEKKEAGCYLVNMDNKLSYNTTESVY